MLFLIIAVECLYKGTEIRLLLSFVAVGNVNDHVYRFLRRFDNKRKCSVHRLIKTQIGHARDFA